MKNSFSIFLLSFFLITTCNANTHDMKNEIQNMPYEEMHALANALSGELTGSPQKGFENFLSYYQRGDTSFKSYLLSTLKRTALASKDVGLRQQATRFMLDIVQNEKEIQLKNEALEGLQRFSEKDFTADSKTILEKMEISNSRELMKIMGAANIKSKEKELRGIAAKANGDRGDQWAATLALARMGDKQKLGEAIEKLKSQTDVMERMWLFDDLAWIKQQEAFNALREYLHSQEHLPDVRDHSKKGSPEAIYAARAIINNVENPPVEAEYRTLPEPVPNFVYSLNIDLQMSADTLIKLNHKPVHGFTPVLNRHSPLL